MNSKLEKLSDTRFQIEIDVDSSDLKDAYTKASQRYAKNANVPGFRKGQAPAEVVRVRFKDEIRQEVLQSLLPEKVAQAIRESGLQPISEPDLHVDDAENVKVDGSGPIKVHVRLEVMPEIPEPKYKGLELVRRVKPVEEGQLDDIIAGRLAQEAALLPVEGRASEIGDTVVADLEGRFDNDPEGEPITAADLEITLGDELIERSFSDNLIGVRDDEEREFTVTYAPDFSSSALAGKTVHYRARVKTVGNKVAPEMNDEWAQSLDEGYGSLAELKDKLRSDLETLAGSDADARVRNNAIAKLIEQNEFEVPHTLIENQARNLLNNFAQDLRRQGVDLNKVEPDFVQMAFSQMHTQAERDVRGAMLLDKVAESENIAVTESEVDVEIEKMAEYYRVTPADIRSSLEKQGGVRTIENNLRTRKTIEAMVAYAKITEGPWVDENIPRDTEDRDGEKTAKKKAPAKKAAK